MMCTCMLPPSLFYLYIFFYYLIPIILYVTEPQPIDDSFVMYMYYIVLFYVFDISIICTYLKTCICFVQLFDDHG